MIDLARSPTARSLAAAGEWCGDGQNQQGLAARLPLDLWPFERPLAVPPFTALLPNRVIWIAFGGPGSTPEQLGEWERELSWHRHARGATKYAPAIVAV